MTAPATFGHFTIERRYDVPPSRVFAAFANQGQKDSWFVDAQALWEPTKRVFEFRDGGREIVAGRWGNGMVTEMDGVYHDIIPDRRFVFTYGLKIDDKRVSVSMMTVEFTADGAGTLMTFTEQGTFLDGFIDGGGREQGTREILSRIDATLNQPVSA